MGVVRLYMTLSVDGYVVGPDDSVDAPMGVGGFRLFNWLDHRSDPGPNGQVFAEQNATRAVISGRRTYEHAGRWQGDHHDGVPVFVLTHDVTDDPPPEIAAAGHDRCVIPIKHEHMDAWLDPATSKDLKRMYAIRRSRV